MIADNLVLLICPSIQLKHARWYTSFNFTLNSPSLPSDFPISDLVFLSTLYSLLYSLLSRLITFLLLPLLYSSLSLLSTTIQHGHSRYDLNPESDLCLRAAISHQLRQ